MLIRHVMQRSLLNSPMFTDITMVLRSLVFDGLDEAHRHTSCVSAGPCCRKSHLTVPRRMSESKESNRQAGAPAEPSMPLSSRLAGEVQPFETHTRGHKGA